MRNLFYLFYKKQNIYILLFSFLLFEGCSKTSNPDTTLNAENPPTPTSISSKISSNISFDIPNTNIIYIGIDNPIIVNAPNVNPKSLKVAINGNGGTYIKYVEDYKYSAFATIPTKDGEGATITISGEGFNLTKNFRVKRMPNPVAKLGKYRSGVIGSGEFKSFQGILADLERFEYDVKCQVQGFILTRIRANEESEDIINRGTKYSEKSKDLIIEARDGDIYLFDNIKCKCPGDKASRKINSMVFKIR